VKRKSKFEKRGSAITIRNTQSGKFYVLLPVRIQTNVRHLYSWTAAGQRQGKERGCRLQKNETPLHSECAEGYLPWTAPELNLSYFSGIYMNHI
jgi:hypothetical protein